MGPPFLSHLSSAMWPVYGILVASAGATAWAGPFSNWRRGSRLPQRRAPAAGEQEDVDGMSTYQRRHTACGKVIPQGRQGTITCAWPPGPLSTGWTSTSFHISASFWASGGLFRKEHSPASWVSSHFGAAESLTALKTKSLCVYQSTRVKESTKHHYQQHSFREPAPFSKPMIGCVLPLVAHSVRIPVAKP